MIDLSLSPTRIKRLKMYKKTILLDLDGVLNEYNGNYIHGYIPPARKDTLNFVKQLSKQYIIKLFTTRDIEIAKKWLNENRLSDYINSVTNTKELAWLIIDDRSIRFDGCYESMLNKINNFEVWYKKEKENA